MKQMKGFARGLGAAGLFCLGAALAGAQTWETEFSSGWSFRDADNDPATAVITEGLDWDFSLRAAWDSGWRLGTEWQGRSGGPAGEVSLNQGGFNDVEGETVLAWRGEAGDRSLKADLSLQGIYEVDTNLPQGLTQTLHALGAGISTDLAGRAPGGVLRGNLGLGFRATKPLDAAISANWFWRATIAPEFEVRLPEAAPDWRWETDARFRFTERLVPRVDARVRSRLAWVVPDWRVAFEAYRLDYQIDLPGWNGAAAVNQEVSVAQELLVRRRLEGGLDLDLSLNWTLWALDGARVDQPRDKPWGLELGFRWRP